jgi:hypothetical protein
MPLGVRVTATSFVVCPSEKVTVKVLIDVGGLPARRSMVAVLPLIWTKTASFPEAAKYVPLPPTSAIDAWSKQESRETFAGAAAKVAVGGVTPEGSL